MNLKKFKKSLVSIVLGSSLFIGNRGVICQQPRAWFPDEFIDSEKEKCAHNPEMTKIINVLKFFSDLHNEPEYAYVLRVIACSSLLHFENLAKVRKSDVTKQFCQFMLTRAMFAATVAGPFKELELEKTDGEIIYQTKELLFEQLCLCSERTIDPVTAILQEELKLIFSVRQIKDLSEMKKLKVETPEGYSWFYNSKIGTQLKHLLNSAIKLLSE